MPAHTPFYNQQVEKVWDHPAVPVIDVYNAMDNSQAYSYPYPTSQNPFMKCFKL